MASSKKQVLAAVLSLFVAGLGQLYIGRYLRGLVFLFLDISTASLLTYSQEAAFILNVGVSLYASYDVYVLAGKEPEEEEEPIPVVFTRP